MTKTERWLNLLAFLLDHHYPVTREEILSQVDDYKAEWLKADDKTRESVRRKFERDKKELKALGVVIEPLKDRVMADHAGQEVEAYLLKPRDFYLPYLEVRGRAHRDARVPARPHETRRAGRGREDGLPGSRGLPDRRLSRPRAVGTVGREAGHGAGADRVPPVALGDRRAARQGGQGPDGR